MATNHRNTQPTQAPQAPHGRPGRKTTLGPHRHPTRLPEPTPTGRLPSPADDHPSPNNFARHPRRQAAPKPNQSLSPLSTHQAGGWARQAAARRRRGPASFSIAATDCASSLRSRIEIPPRLRAYGVAPRRLVYPSWLSATELTAGVRYPRLGLVAAHVAGAGFRVADPNASPARSPGMMKSTPRVGYPRSRKRSRHHARSSRRSAGTLGARPAIRGP
jgi:hypothetical protein